MPDFSDAEFQRLAVLHAMGALSPDEAALFEAERARRGAEGARIEGEVRSAVERAAGSRGLALSEREALSWVTAPHLAAARPWIWMAAVIVLGVALVTALAWGFAQRSSAAGEAEAARLKAAEADSLRAQVEETEATLAAQPPAGDLAGLLAAPGLTVVPLESEGESGARGALYNIPGGGALLVARGLPSLGGGTYQLWRATDPPEPVVALGDAPSGFLFAVFGEARFVDGTPLFVTAEHAAGATIPAEPAVLRAGTQ